jgi:hypothetical protein
MWSDCSSGFTDTAHTCVTGRVAIARHTAPHVRQIKDLAEKFGRSVIRVGSKIGMIAQITPHLADLEMKLLAKI